MRSVPLELGLFGQRGGLFATLAEERLVVGPLHDEGSPAFFRNLVGIGPAVALIFYCQRALTNQAHFGPGTSGIILASGELGLCDGGHPLFVMKKRVSLLYHE